MIALGCRNQTFEYIWLSTRGQYTLFIDNENLGLVLSLCSAIALFIKHCVGLTVLCYSIMFNLFKIVTYRVTSKQKLNRVVKVIISRLREAT